MVEATAGHCHDEYKTAMIWFRFQQTQTDNVWGLIRKFQECFMVYKTCRSEVHSIFASSNCSLVRMLPCYLQQDLCYVCFCRHWQASFLGLFHQLAGERKASLYVSVSSWNEETLMSRIITGEGRWVCSYHQEKKQQLSQWKSSTVSKTRQVASSWERTRSILVIFFNIPGNESHRVGLSRQSSTGKTSTQRPSSGMTCELGHENTIITHDLPCLLDLPRLTSFSSPKWNSS